MRFGIASSIAALTLVSVPVRAIPRGFLTFFDRLDCPEGWEEYAPARGRLVVSVSNATNAGETVGTPLGDREDRGHSHTTSLQGTLPQQNVAALGGSNDQGAQNGEVSTTIVSNISSSGLPFSQVLMCRNKVANETEPIAIGTIAFFDPSRSTCPKGWAPMHNVNGRFLIPGFAEGGSFPNNAIPLAPGEDRRHAHTSVSIDVIETSVSYIGIDGCCNDSPAQYAPTLTLTGEAKDASSELPYIQLLTCVSEQQTFNLTLPDGALVFNEEYCPSGWMLEPDLAGRMLVGLPDGGIPGAAFGGQSLNPSNPEDPLHGHGVEGEIALPATGIELDSGCCAGGYTGSGSLPVVGATTAGDVNLPFTLLPLCRSGQSKAHGGTTLQKTKGRHERPRHPLKKAPRPEQKASTAKNNKKPE